MTYGEYLSIMGRYFRKDQICGLTDRAFEIYHAKYGVFPSGRKQKSQAYELLLHIISELEIEQLTDFLFEYGISKEVAEEIGQCLVV